jgi:predicted AAA+ superfamily ATPase
MMEDLLFRYNPWWEEQFNLPGIIRRPAVEQALTKRLNINSVDFITGLRRIGKTTILKLVIKHLLDVQHCAPRQILYVSMDDYALSKKTISDVIDEFRKIQKLPYDLKIYLFLDEIASQKDFEIQLKNIHDNSNAKIFASSSSASILRSKKSFLTGRNSTIEVVPLDFNEYLRFRDISILKRDRHLLQGHFEDFLKIGGLPEYVLHVNDDYLRDLVDDIILKDIAAVHNVRNTGQLKDLFLLLMERAGKAVSINKIAHILGVSPDTSRRFIDMFVETYLVYLLPRFGKTNETVLAPKKIYAADLGIRALFTGMRDKGSLFENYVYLKIRKTNPRYIYKDGCEIDFLTGSKTLIEVKYFGEMTGEQEKSFKAFKAERKLFIQSPLDLEKLETA